MVSELVFDEDFFEYIRNPYAENGQLRVVVSRILFQLRGAITTFVLYIQDKLDVEDEDIINWISFLSRKGIKDLSIMNRDNTPLKLPTHLFSCLELKHLELVNCCFSLPPTFHGFPNLLSLELRGEFSEVGEIITQCPLLEKLILFYLVNEGEVKLADIAELKNLKLLSFSLSSINSFHSFELLGSLPKLQELHLNFMDYKVTEGGAKKRLCAAFPSLKALKLFFIDLGNGVNLSCAFELIKSCPNLHTLEIVAIQQKDADPIPIPEVEYDNITGLRSVELKNFEGSENEVHLIKYLFACSPLLKKIVIRPRFYLAPGEELMLARKLLKLRRASALAEIDFY